MAVMIKKVAITKDSSTWDSVKNSYTDWGDLSTVPAWWDIKYNIHLPVIVAPGEQITITVLAEDATWDTIKNDFTSWDDVKTKLPNWKAVQNYH